MFAADDVVSSGEALGQASWFDEKQRIHAAPTSRVRLRRQGKDFGSVVGDSDCVLTVHCPAACRTSERPPIRVCNEFSGIGHDSWLQCQQ